LHGEEGRERESVLDEVSVSQINITPPMTLSHDERAETGRGEEKGRGVGNGDEEREEKRESEDRTVKCRR
jgi:hypothetical protein